MTLVLWYICKKTCDVVSLFKGSTIFHEEVGAGGISRTPITNYHAPPPTQSLFLMPPHPPQTVIYFWVTPPSPFKRYIIIIKPHMNIFCSVQYDLYFLFNVKLLTTHSTDVAATSVNSKNIFCPFAKALLHYFSKSKSQFPIFRLWIFQSVSLLASQLLPRHR